MEKIMNEIAEFVKKDESAFNDLKTFASQHELINVSINLREKESDYFPETKEMKKVKESVITAKGCLAMTGMVINDEKAVYIIASVIGMVNKLGEQFSLKDAAEIKMKADEIYGK